MTFYVINTADRSVSWPAQQDASAGESFATLTAAQKRASRLAKSEPGNVFEIVKSIAEVQCPVGKPKVTKR